MAKLLILVIAAFLAMGIYAEAGRKEMTEPQTVTIKNIQGCYEIEIVARIYTK